jgi:hypothetical protein
MLSDPNGLKVGDLVICIDDEFDPISISLIPYRPKEGKYYQIREAFPSRFGMACRLVELHNPRITEAEFSFEPSFHQRRFERISNITSEEFEAKLFTKELITA